MNDDDAWIQQQIIQSSNAALLPELSMKIFREKLAAYIHELINNNFLLLINWLYRLDVSEQKLKELLASEAPSDAGFVIADLIIERQLQKIKSRKQFRTDGENIPEDEKW